MQQKEKIRTIGEAGQKAVRCPVDHGSHQKTALTRVPAENSVVRDTNGVWHIYGFEEARAVLRSADTKQAGFNAELLERIPQTMNTPILYMEGRPHHQQRKMTARYFTPKAVSTNYRQLMERQADQAIARIKQAGRADLSMLSLDFASRVAGEVIGLTDSRLPGMAQRLEAFFEQPVSSLSWNPLTILNFVRSQSRSLIFFLLDVKPAIRARRKKLQEDVISHLVSQKYSDPEILLECITYAAAGMVTTREFISVATWHFLEQPDLRARYLASSEDERYEILHEILRLEPVVGHLYRRTIADLTIESADQLVVIPVGALIKLHIYDLNADELIVGEQPLMIRPQRELKGERVPSMLMGFGDGHHRCPGSYIAMQESDILLQRLLAIESLHMVRQPVLSRNDMIESYELRKFVIAVDEKGGR